MSDRPSRAASWRKTGRDGTVAAPAGAAPPAVRRTARRSHVRRADTGAIIDLPRTRSRPARRHAATPSQCEQTAGRPASPLDFGRIRRRAEAQYHRLSHQEVSMVRPAGLTLALAVVLAGSAAGAAPPDVSGKWRLDRKRSDDVKARIAAAAGPDQTTGGGASGLTILPESNTRSEVERVEMRAWMMGLADQLDRLEIQQSADEVKLYLGDDNVR